MCNLPSSGSLVIKALLVENSFHLKEGDKENAVELKGPCHTKRSVSKGKGLIIYQNVEILLRHTFFYKELRFSSCSYPRKKSLLLFLKKVFVCQNQSNLRPRCLRLQNVHLEQLLTISLMFELNLSFIQQHQQMGKVNQSYYKKCRYYYSNSKTYKYTVYSKTKKHKYFLYSEKFTTRYDQPAR